ncbi:MAG: ClbS/DfsB family four-helix bundle protein [Caldilineaceae bacterium]
MRKEQLVEKLERAWDELKQSYAGLPEGQMVEPGLVGDWSVKDVLAHVTTWEEEALKHLPHILLGETPPRYSVTYGGLDAFNALMTGRKRELPLDEVLRQLDETHGRLVAYIQGAPEELFATETRFRRRIRLDTYSHYPIHTKMIAEWRARRGE